MSAQQVIRIKNIGLEKNVGKGAEMVRILI